MRNRFMLAAVAGLLIGPASFLTAAPRDRSPVDEAIAVLDELAKTPEKMCAAGSNATPTR